MKNAIKALLKSATELLQSTSQTPRFDAEILLAHVLQKPEIFLHTWPEYSVDENTVQHFFALIEKRCEAWPVAYLTGSQPFWSLDLMVNQSTLIPRPETECLVEAALAKLNKKASTPFAKGGRRALAPFAKGGSVAKLRGGFRAAGDSLIAPFEKGADARRLRLIGDLKIADLGTGSGAVGLALAKELPHAQVFATDISEAALEVAILNATQLNIKNIQFFQGSWCEPLPHLHYDLIVSNPPYIASEESGLLSVETQFEPVNALFSEADGLKAICDILNQVPSYLKPQGYFLVEHGFSQGGKVRSLFKEAGFTDIFTVRDYGGHERVTGALYK